MKKERKKTEKICGFCKEKFIAKSKSAKFCSSNCRQDNYLRNKLKKTIEEIDNEILELNELLPGLFCLLDQPENISVSEMTKLSIENKIDLELYRTIIKIKAKLVLLENKRKNIG